MSREGGGGGLPTQLGGWLYVGSGYMGERQLSRLQNFCTVVHGPLVPHPWNIGAQ